MSAFNWLDSTDHVCGGRWIIELEQFQKQSIWSGNHDIAPAVPLPQSVRGRNALQLQPLPLLAQIGNLDAEMMYGAAASISGSLIVEVETAAPHRKKDISGSC